jgi:hypothetical protein
MSHRTCVESPDQPSTTSVLTVLIVSSGRSGQGGSGQWCDPAGRRTFPGSPTGPTGPTGPDRPTDRPTGPTGRRGGWACSCLAWVGRWWRAGVPEAGFEPARPCEQWILSPPCLPFHHSGNEPDGSAVGSRDLPAKPSRTRREHAATTEGLSALVKSSVGDPPSGAGLRWFGQGRADRAAQRVSAETLKPQ